MDGNKDRKGSELGAAAGDFVAKMNGTDTEETATEPETTEVAEEPSAEETPEKEPEVTWRLTVVQHAKVQCHGLASIHRGEVFGLQGGRVSVTGDSRKQR